MPERSVLIGQGLPGGHRLKYVRLLIDAALDRNWRVVLAVGFDPARNPEFDAHLRPVARLITIVPVASANLRTITRVARQVGVDHVVIPDGDAFAAALGRRARWNTSFTVSVLAMRNPASETAGSPLRRIKLIIKERLLRRAGRLGGVSVYRLASAGSTLGRASSDVGGIAYVADPVTLSHSDDSVDRLRLEWGLGSDVFWFGVLGAITRRKNLPLVSQALTGVGAGPVGLLVAGVSDRSWPGKSDIDELGRSGVRVVQQDRLLTDLELDSAIVAVDCVVVLHSNEGPSGILGKAIAAGTRVVAGGAKTLRDDVEALGYGSWSPLDVPDIRSALTSAIRAPAPTPRPGVLAGDFAHRLLM